MLSNTDAVIIAIDIIIMRMLLTLQQHMIPENISEKQIDKEVR